MNKTTLNVSMKKEYRFLPKNLENEEVGVNNRLEKLLGRSVISFGRVVRAGFIALEEFGMSSGPIETLGSTFEFINNVSRDYFLTNGYIEVEKGYVKK